MIHEPNMDCISKEYKDILDNSETIINENKSQPCHLERIYGNILVLMLVLILL